MGERRAWQVPLFSLARVPLLATAPSITFVVFIFYLNGKKKVYSYKIKQTNEQYFRFVIRAQATQVCERCLKVKFVAAGGRHF